VNRPNLPHAKVAKENRPGRNDAVDLRWNATSGRVLPVDAARRRPEVAVHLLHFAAARLRLFRPRGPLVVARDLRIERSSDARITARAVAVRFLAALVGAAWDVTEVNLAHATNNGHASPLPPATARRFSRGPDRRCRGFPNWVRTCHVFGQPYADKDRSRRIPWLFRCSDWSEAVPAGGANFCAVKANTCGAPVLIGEHLAQNFRP